MAGERKPSDPIRRQDLARDPALPLPLVVDWRDLAVEVRAPGLAQRVVLRFEQRPVHGAMVNDRSRRAPPKGRASSPSEETRPDRWVHSVLRHASGEGDGPRGRAARRVPERARAHRHRGQDPPDRRARAHGPEAPRGGELRPRRRDPAAVRRGRRAERASTSPTTSTSPCSSPTSAGSRPRSSTTTASTRSSSSSARPRRTTARTSTARSPTRWPRSSACCRGSAEAGLRPMASIATSFGCPYEGHVPQDQTSRPRRADGRGRRRGDQLRRHHRHGQPAPGARRSTTTRYSGSPASS